MAYNFRQQSRIRKFGYLGIIFALFTVSLLHRKLIIEPKANYLELREVARGEAELSGAAVRLLLTGSSGLATTFLWSYALDLQETHQFNELKLVVESITRLQPHFSTPWIFQSWNLSFNVAVEFDAPRDKYFYVSEGLNLLARGERVNQGGLHVDDGAEGKLQRGNPDMRWFLGFTFQSKIGKSDENTTMRSLLDLSCIEPSKRDPQRFYVLDPRSGKQLIVRAFEEFCKENPRLVRRLHDSLNITDPMRIVEFLENNKEVPGRFVFDTRAQKYVLKEWKEQFPILPAPFPTGVPSHKGTPDPKDPALSRGEGIDVFLVSRTWYEYAQLPLPPPRDTAYDRGKVDEMRYRIPRRGWIIIFRQYPCRAQAYISESLQAEGWFDGEGWDIRPWLVSKGLEPSEAGPMPVGRDDPKYHSGVSWAQTYDFFKDFGEKNGLYLSAAQRDDLEKKASEFRRHRLVNFGQAVNVNDAVERMPGEEEGPLAELFNAHIQLQNVDLFKGTINFDDFLYQSAGEKQPETLLARKMMFQAKRLSAQLDSDRARKLYEDSLPLWRDIFLKNPRFSLIDTVQEDLYELQLDYMRMVQKDEYKRMTNVLAAMADLPIPPRPFWLEHGVVQVGAEEARRREKVMTALLPALSGDPALFVPALAQAMKELAGDEFHPAYLPAAETLYHNAGRSTIRFRTVRGPLERLQVAEGDTAATFRAALVLGQGLAAPTPLFVPTQPGMYDPAVLVYRVADRKDLPDGWYHLLREGHITSVRGQREMPMLEDEPPPGADVPVER